MQQLYLFEEDKLKNTSLDRIINVASVPQRSPFRYPGGKTWLVPRIRQWLATLTFKPVEFIEPFAGGGIISLTIAFEELAQHVTMVELDDQIAAVWQTILNEDGKKLADRIITFELTTESVKAILGSPALTLEEKAFQTVLKNRVNRGGILAAGAGMVKNGENGRGLKSRWYPETLKRRILNILSVKHNMTFIEGDGLKVLQQNAYRQEAVFFIDPPYTAAGKKAGTRLYSCSELDHEELFKITASLAGDFLMTYDDTEEIRGLAERFGFDTQSIAMKNTHHAKMSELLIGRCLDWVRDNNA